MTDTGSMDRIIQFFDRLAPSWKEDSASAPIREEIVKRSRFPAGSRIADIGCGRGVMVPHLLRTDPSQLIELDISGEMMRLNRERWGAHPRVTFHCGNVLEAALPTLDAAMIFNAYPHLMEKKTLAARLSKLLSPGGTVVVAHSAGKEFINGIHRGDGPCERISVPLRTPPEEYADFREAFTLTDWEDTPRLYYMKLTKK